MRNRNRAGLAYSRAVIETCEARLDDVYEMILNEDREGRELGGMWRALARIHTHLIEKREREKGKIERTLKLNHDLDEDDAYAVKSRLAFLDRVIARDRFSPRLRQFAEEKRAKLIR